MRIITYNINGIRAAMNKGLADWVKAADPDVLCLQEIKATPDQVNTAVFEEMGYHLYWYPAQKKGYSGVAIFSKEKAQHVEYGCGIEQYDFEGRVLRIDLSHCSVMSVYHPSGSSGDERQSFKMKWLSDFQSYIKCHEKVDEVYKNVLEWTKKSIINVANMGYFSSDRTIAEYAKDIWGIKV